MVSGSGQDDGVELPGSCIVIGLKSESYMARWPSGPRRVTQAKACLHLRVSHLGIQAWVQIPLLSSFSPLTIGTANSNSAATGTCVSTWISDYRKLCGLSVREMLADQLQPIGSEVTESVHSMCARTSDLAVQCSRKVGLACRLL